MNHGLTWHLEIFDHEIYEKTKYEPLATTVENFFTLQDVWNFLGFRLKKQRCGYSGLKGNIEYRVWRI